jgi:diguanylate cyclase (GGDEF)-like protein
MTQARPRTTTARRSGADKRAYPRIPLRLAASCVSAAGASRACEIRNFCAGGLLLYYSPQDHGEFLPVVGNHVDVRARWPEGPDGRDIRFRARIVRAEPDSVGVALIDPDPSALRVLIHCFETQRGLRHPAGDRQSSPTDRANAAALMTACRERVLAATPRLAEDFVNQIAGELSGFGLQGGVAGKQHDRLEFLDLIRSERGNLVTQFRSSVAECIGNLRKRTHGQDATRGALTLLGNEELEEWLSVSEIANHVESRLAGPLDDLERRIGFLTGRPVDRQNNPFAPHVFAGVFQQLIQSLHPAQSIRQTCSQVFKLLLTEWMETLCRDLNNLLVERGILPELKPAIVRNKGRQPHPAQPPATKADPPTQHAATGRERDSDLYSIVRNIRHLQHQYGHRVTATADACDGALPAARILSPDEIVAALSRLQIDAGSARERTGSAPGQPRVLRDQLLSVITAATDSPRQLGARESGIIDVADALFSSMLRDGQVGESVRSWLHRLTVPLLKLAMHDDSIFTDRDHAAREVVNRIAQLELQDDGAGGHASSLRREVDRLVDAIGAEAKPDLAVFTKALKKLNLLITVQNNAYAENLKEVIAACESSPVHPPASDGGEIDDETRVWLKRIGRMKAGDWVLFAIAPAEPQRLRLAWISTDRDHYVFVNNLGLKEAIYDRVALARCFANDEAALIDSADEPALDRAQYSMLQNLNRQLLHETTHDQLTGLMNRKEFERWLRLALDKTHGAGIPHSLLHVDLAQFNVINISCGHETGDRVLREVADLLQKTAGPQTTIARIGSDEFAILLAEHAPDEPLALAQEIIDAVRGYHFTWGDESGTVSLGIGVVHVGDFAGLTELLQGAEASCRAARSLGMDQVQVYRPDNATHASRNDTLKWLIRIDRALSEDTLELRCQRIMPIDAPGRQDRPHHREILLGITDDDGAPVSPQQFIITAENFQRMPAIDRWVVSTVLRYIVTHRARMDELGGFAINLSGCSLSDGSFKDFVREEIARTGAPMEYVCFEVTETAGITSLSDAADFITEIRKTGCRFSLDDFGSGMSSYVYLKNLPVDYLKIDGSFVRNMDSNPADFAVVKSITEIGRFMGKKIIAECVESETVLAQLREIGVDFVQGYAIERPVWLRDLT